MPSDAQEKLTKEFAVTAVGPFWKIVENAPAAPIEAYSFVEREPSWWEWYFVSGTEPHREIAPDPYLTWELRDHFHQPAEPPKEPPKTLEQRRVAHNLALAQGDAARAASLLAEIERELRPLHARFEDGSEIVGARFDDGARPLLTLILRAGDPPAADAQLTVRSRVIAKAPWSLTIADPTEREVGLPLPIAPQRWKKGYLYSDRVPIRKRPGAEVFRAMWWVRGKGIAPRPVGGDINGVEVLTLR
jgi:hypothetical protein